MHKLLTLVFALFVSAAWSQTQVWDLDKSHSSINFAIDHMVISETTGKFDAFTVEAKADKPDFTDAKFRVEIEAKSINTADEKRDGHLKNADFFDVEKFPKIIFEGKSFSKQKNGQYKVTGTLTIHGISKEVTLDGKFNGIVKDPWGGTRAGLKIWGVLDRYDYGLKYNSVLEAGGLAVGKEVRLNASVELVKKVEAAPTTKK